MQKIKTFLWYQTEAEEAATFYVSLFKNSRIGNVMRAGDAAIAVDFVLDGVELTALNGNPSRNFTEAMSLFVDCEGQEEVDRLWNALIVDGGEESQCGWLKDKYGVSWQVIPKQLMEYLGSSNQEGAGRAMQAMMGMQKIDVAALKKAHDGA